VQNVGRGSPCRFVIDESSLNFRGLSASEIEHALDDMMDTLRCVRDDAGGAAVAPLWEYVECLEDCELYEFLSGSYPSEVNLDTLRLAYSMMSKCPEWDERSAPGIGNTVSIDGGPGLTAWSVEYALLMTVQGTGIACLVFPGKGRSGFVPVRAETHTADVFFLSEIEQLPTFWRSLFALESVPEDQFFSLGALAFPKSVLHPDLSFARFDGSYNLLRDRVVAVLAALDDHFRTEFRRCNGLPHEVQAAFGCHGFDLSPESSNTRKSEKLMRLRDVEYEGQVYRCEWHAKLEPQRNRIHFAVPDSCDGKILVGIFVDHLDI
jgi:hypothetical protein